MADPMRIRAQAQGDKAVVRVLMSHEMETGQRKDASGKVIPAWHINEVTAALNGKPVLTAEWGPAVAKNPFLQFTIKGAKAGDKVEVRVLMSHEMETGQRKDSKGATIPAWFISNVTATHNGKTVLSAEWGPAVAKNPFLAFRFAGGKPGDKVQITWTDNKGDKRTDEVKVS